MGQQKGIAKGKGEGKHKGKNKMGSVESMVNPITGRPFTASETKVMRTIKFLNKSLESKLPIKLKYLKLKDALDLVDEKSQLRILQNFRTKIEDKKNIQNPYSWLANACKKSAEKFEEFQQDRWQKKKAASGDWSEAPKKKKKQVEVEEEWTEE